LANITIADMDGMGGASNTEILNFTLNKFVFLVVFLVMLISLYLLAKN
jgi:hypothetical protein